MDRDAFDIYIETQLTPELLPGTVVILDNLSTHKSPKVAEILNAQGCWMLFLPAYSPDLNPNEMAFSKLKAHLHLINARTYDTLIQPLAISAACSILKSVGASLTPPDTHQIEIKPL